MKKSLLLILASLFTVFALTGCADEEKNDTPVITQPTLSEPVITQPTLSESDLKSLQGTYDIEFFYTYATVATLTNDCSKLQEYVGSDAKCSNITDQSEMQGKGSIAVSNDYVKIITKVQLDGGGFNNQTLAQFAKNQKYNYTVYNDIPVSAVKDNYLNLDNVTKGTTGRNADSLAGSKDDTYNITIENGIVIIDMIKDTGISIAKTAPVVVRMKKVSDNVETLDPNTAFPTPDISNIFKADIGYNN